MSKASCTYDKFYVIGNWWMCNSDRHWLVYEDDCYVFWGFIKTFPMVPGLPNTSLDELVEG